MSWLGINHDMQLPIVIPKYDRLGAKFLNSPRVLSPLQARDRKEVEDAGLKPYHASVS
jgi:hypothetical protein